MPEPAFFMLLGYLSRIQVVNGILNHIDRVSDHSHCMGAFLGKWKHGNGAHSMNRLWWLSIGMKCNP